MQCDSGFRARQCGVLLMLLALNVMIMVFIYAGFLGGGLPFSWKPPQRRDGVICLVFVFLFF